MDYRAAAINEMAWRIAHENIGIYPQAVHGDGGYEKRTERMEGWNDCAIEHSRHYGAVKKWLKELPTEHREQVENLLLRDVINLHIRDGGVSMSVNCNDLFFWGCSDCEDIELSELPALDLALRDAAGRGMSEGGELLWVSRKRGMRPQGAYYKYFAVGVRPLFDACGPDREVGFGNPEAPPVADGDNVP